MAPREPEVTVLGLGDTFQAILQLLQLVDALIENATPKEDSHGRNAMITGMTGTRKDFDYLDAVTNLMVRDDEVVAAVSCGGPLPTRGVIMVDSPCKTPGPSDGNAQVRLQSTSYVY
jgi:hypothetical protein